MQNNLSTLYNKSFKKKRRYVDCDFTKDDDFMQIIFGPRLKTNSSFKKKI